MELCCCSHQVTQVVPTRRLSHGTPARARKGTQSQDRWLCCGPLSGRARRHTVDLVAVQTWNGAQVVPVAALIPINKDYMVRQAGLDLERVIRGNLEGGLDLDDAQAAWDRAIGHMREVAERQRIDQT